MSGSSLLDTNVVIDLLREQSRPASPPVGRGTIAVNAVVAGELIFGAIKSKRSDEKLKSVNAFDSKTTVHPCTVATSVCFAELKLFLANIGKPILSNDVWVAASAIEHNLILVTRDSHFDHIPHLTKERW